jgi:hypothetical protein
MFRTWWVHRLFGRPFPRRARRARAVRPQVTWLEDRTVPATVTYTAATDLLVFQADAGEADAVTVTAPAANQVVVQVGGGDTITLAGDAAPPDFVLSGGNATLTINTAAANAPVANFQLNLDDQGDTLAFGLGTTPNGVSNVAIDGGAGADVVTLTATTVPGGLSATAETINLDGNLLTDGGAVALTGNVVVRVASVTIDTEQGDDGNAGAVAFAGGTISANAFGNDLSVVTTTGGAFAGGAIAMVAAGNGPGRTSTT